MPPFGEDKGFTAAAAMAGGVCCNARTCASAAANSVRARVSCPARSCRSGSRSQADSSRSISLLAARIIVMTWDRSALMGTNYLPLSCRMSRASAPVSPRPENRDRVVHPRHVRAARLQRCRAPSPRAGIDCAEKTQLVLTIVICHNVGHES